MDARSLLIDILAFGALPAWLLAGAADWWCHRRTAIEHTSGSRESALHLLLHAEIAIPLLLGLWLEINLGLLAFMTLCVIAHMITSLVDTRLAQPRRHISPIEQQIHSWLEMMPLFGLVGVTLVHLEALSAAQWLPRLREQPLPLHWRVLVPLALAAGFAFIIEEYARGRRAQRNYGAA